jgi:hypothetical protein
VSALHAGATPEHLVPGDEPGLAALAATMRRYSDGCAQAERTLRSIEDGVWVGEAADVFRTHVEELPAKLGAAATAFSEAERAVHRFVDELHEGRRQARRAVELYAAAEELTDRWEQDRAEHRAAVQQYRAAHPGILVDPVDAGLRPPVSYDPGAEDRTRAERLLADAQADVGHAARQAAATLRAAGELAPDEPGLLSRAVGQVGQFLIGAGEALYGLAEFAFKLSPTYLLIDPEGFIENAVGLGQGLLYGLQHPKEFGKALLDWDTWATNPARALGHLVPDLLLALATGGAGTAAVRTARAGRVVDDLASTGQGLRRMADAPAELRATWAQRFDDPVDGARSFQGAPPYSGVDDWAQGWADKGHQFSGGWPGPGQFVVPRHVVDELGGDARRYYEGVQVQSRVMTDGGPATYRGQMRTYEVLEPLPLGVSVARNNPQFGPGGLPQYFLPDDLADLIEGGYVREVGQTPMSGTVAGIRPEGVPGVEAVTAPTLGEDLARGAGGAAAGAGVQGLERVGGDR